MNNVFQATQRALQAYLRAQQLTFLPPDGSRIYTSILNETAIVPAVLAKCARGRCKVKTDGTWLALARVELREAKDSTSEDDHFERAGELYGCFFTGQELEDINATAPDQYSVQYLNVTDAGWLVEGRLWVSFIDLELDCCTALIG